MRSFIWLSFDFGVRADYEGMYEFLDSHAAKECGDSLGAFWFEYKKDLFTELAKEIRAAVDIDKRSRIYVVYPSGQGKTRGKFIIGKRKWPAWSGFGPSRSDDDEEDIGE
jgi:hypothetical protein